MRKRRVGKQRRRGKKHYNRLVGGTTADARIIGDRYEHNYISVYIPRYGDLIKD